MISFCTRWHFPNVSKSQTNLKLEYGWITKRPAFSILSFSDKIAFFMLKMYTFSFFGNYRNFEKLSDIQRSFTEPNLLTNLSLTSQPANEFRKVCFVFRLSFSNSLWFSLFFSTGQEVKIEKIFFRRSRDFLFPSKKIFEFLKIF